MQGHCRQDLHRKPVCIATYKIKKLGSRSFREDYFYFSFPHYKSMEANDLRVEPIWIPKTSFAGFI